MEDGNNENAVREELAFLESYVSSTEKQISVMTQGLEEFGKALAVLQSKEIPESSETLISLGGGIFVKGKVETSKNVMVAIGSDVFIEEDSQKTVERIKAQVEDVSKGIQTLNNQRADAIRRYDLLLRSLGRKEDKDVS